MKRLLALMALLLLLSGCEIKEPEQTTNETVETTQPTVSTQPVIQNPSLYDPDNPAEELTEGAIKAYPLGDSLSIGIMFMGEDMLVVSAAESGTNLVLLSAEECSVTLRQTLESSLIVQEGTMRVTRDGIVYYDESSCSLVFLNQNLQETDRMALPQGMIGLPVISEDLSTVYYCTENKIHALNVETGISRLLRQQECQRQSLNGVYFSDTVLECAVTEHDGTSYVCFLSTQNGELLGLDNELFALDVWQERFFLSRSEGYLEEYLFGTKNGQVSAFLGDRAETYYSLLPLNGVLGITRQETGSTVSFYDLETGKRTAAEELPVMCAVHTVLGDPARQCVWMIAYDAENQEDVIYRWELAASQVSGGQVYTGVRYTYEQPDVQGIAQLQTWADALAAQYGVEIDLFQDVLEPDNYSFDVEYRVDALRYGLEQLDKALSVYPEGLLERAVETTSTGVLRVGLVRDISDDSSGVQYWVDGDAYIVLEIGDHTEQSVHHEISHVLDNYIIANSYAYDDWEELSPKGFRYDYNYDDHKTRCESPYLEGEDRAFIDSYSMSYPKEDRARILEYAMMPDNAELFASETMQNKLLHICQGIRECFEYEKYEGTFLWEQYLEESLAYVKKKK